MVEQENRLCDQCLFRFRSLLPNIYTTSRRSPFFKLPQSLPRRLDLQLDHCRPTQLENSALLSRFFYRIRVDITTVMQIRCIAYCCKYFTVFLIDENLDFRFIL